MSASDGLRILDQTEYEAWDALVDSSPQGSVFCRSWWLKASQRQARILGLFDGGRLVAGIPLYYERRLGVRFCTMPPLASTWGVVVEPLKGRSASRLSRETDILTHFAGALQKELFFYQRFHPNLTNWLAFHWNGFKQTSRATYVLTDLKDEQRLWDNMSPQTQDRIHEANRTGIIIEECSVNVLLDITERTFASRKSHLSFITKHAGSIYSAARANNSGACLAARDAHGRVRAAILLVWDKKRAYYLAGASYPDSRDGGSLSALLWRGIRHVSDRSEIFDFQNAATEPEEELCRNFGATQMPYNEIRKMPVPIAMYLLMARKM